MVKTVCRILKGVFVTAWMCVSSVQAASNQHVDGGCVNSGNGACDTSGNRLAATCANQANWRCATTNNPSANGPYNTLQGGVNALASAGGGSHLIIKGAHDGRHGTANYTSTSHKCGTSRNPISECSDNIWDGRYGNDVVGFSGINGSAGSPIIVEPFGYSGPGDSSREQVYIESSDAPDGGAIGCQSVNCGWTRCPWNPSSGNCDAPCEGVPDDATSCESTWYVTPPADFNMSLAIAAQKADGTVLAMYPNLSDLTANGRSSSNGSRIWARWGTTTEPPKAPYVLFNNNGYGFYLPLSTGSTASYITIRGLNFRGFRYSGVVMITDAAAGGRVGSNFVITDNRFSYHVGANTGHAIASYLNPNVTISDNDISYTSCEAIHTQAPLSDATPINLTISGNYIHDICDQTVMGTTPCSQGASTTPHCMTLGDSGTGFGGGNYSGSLIYNNICKNIHNWTTEGHGKGMQLENHHHGSKIYNNVFQTLDGAAIQFSSSAGTGVYDVDVYNNLFIDVGNSPGSSTTLAIEMSDKSHSNDIYNNTSYGQGLIATYGTSTTCHDNIIRNNVIDSGTTRGVWFSDSSDTTNKFEYNFIRTTSNPAATWAGAKVSGGPNYTCAQLTNIAASNIVDCPNPLFVNTATNDFHLQSTSLAIDSGTTSIRTNSINNTLAELHGLPDYSDNLPQGGSAWDMGATEGVGTNMLTDGDFESGAFGSGKWQRTTVDCLCDASVIGTVAERSGSYSAEIPIDSCVDVAVSPCKGIYVELENLTIGNVYKVSGYVRSDLSDGTLQIRQYSVTSANAHCNYETAGASCVIANHSVGVSGVYDYFVSIFEAEATSHVLRFKATPSGTPGTLYLDDVEITPYTVTP